MFGWFVLWSAGGKLPVGMNMKDAIHVVIADDSDYGAPVDCRIVGAFEDEEYAAELATRMEAAHSAIQGLQAAYHKAREAATRMLEYQSVRRSQGELTGEQKADEILRLVGEYPPISKLEHTFRVISVKLNVT
jgi:hypothetical protein